MVTGTVWPQMKITPFQPNFAATLSQLKKGANNLMAKQESFGLYKYIILAWVHYRKQTMYI